MIVRTVIVHDKKSNIESELQRLVESGEANDEEEMKTAEPILETPAADETREDRLMAADANGEVQIWKDFEREWLDAFAETVPDPAPGAEGGGAQEMRRADDAVPRPAGTPIDPFPHNAPADEKTLGDLLTANDGEWLDVLMR